MKPLIHKRKAMILAAGLGERMKPLTLERPKPLIEVAGKTMIERILDHLSTIGTQSIVINTFYKREMIKEHLKHHKHIQFSDEKELLDTGGGVLKALPYLGQEAFFVFNSDAVWLGTTSLNKMHECWDDEKMDFLLLLVPRGKAFGYEGQGDFFKDEAGHLIRKGKEKYAPYVYAGVQIIHPRAFKTPPSHVFSLNLLWDKAIEHNRLFGLIHESDWFHIGTPSALITYEQQILVLENRS